MNTQVKRILFVLLSALFLGPLLPSDCDAQEIDTSTTESAKVQLNFPDQTEVKLLVDYVSTRLGIKILFDESVANKKITIKAPGEIPADTLLGLLESALKIKGLALVDAAQPGWKQIVETKDLQRIAEPTAGQPLEDFSNTTAVTQAFQLKHIDPQRISQIIKPFLTEPGANTIPVEDQKLLIVTDYADNLKKITALIESIDRAGPERTLEFYTVQHVEASSLAQQITQSLASRSTGQNRVPGTSPVEINHDERTNKLLIVATRSQIQEVFELAKALDIPLGLRTEVYTFQFVDANRIDKLVQELFDPLTIKRLFRSAVDEEENLLVATATNEIHERINWLQKQMDVESKRPGSAVKFYRLKHADAVEVLGTIQSIQQSQGPSRLTRLRGVSSIGRGRVGADRFLGQGFSQQGQQFVPGPNHAAIPGAPPVQTPAFREPIPGGNQPLGGIGSGTGGFGLVSSAARVTADPSSNTIIVVADRSTHEVYSELIEYLDRRPPQVMIEVKVLTIDTTDNFSLGVEFSTGDRSGAKRLLEFTQFGLGMVDPISGALAITPGRGFNWTLVSPEDGDAIVRAIATHGRARFRSSPRILVNDNQTGTLASVQEVPFTSVNASNTVATTSFAGFAEAGTTIEVTPRISDDDHLQLDYVVSLNSFTGTGGDGVPPPRQTNEISSNVTIPDGYTIIAGGLNISSSSYSYEGIPWVEHIPIVKELTGITTEANSQTTLFVFLKPTILRDDKFRDLKYISDRSLGNSNSAKNYPESRPLFLD